jgi:hypothetical protein
MKSISDIVNNVAGASDKAFSSGLYIAGQRYVMTTFSAEDKTIYARKVRTKYMRETPFEEMSS